MNSNFFSLFNLPARQFRPDALITLGEVMHGPRSRILSSNIESGYVYFGQFLVHDISRLKSGDEKPVFQQQPLEDLEQLRNPGMELDSVYGNGFYDERIRLDGGEFLLGQALGRDGTLLYGSDLPRDPTDKTALIGDDRNDENLIVAQLHLQFLKLHNYFCQRLRANGGINSDADLYAQAKRQVVLRYQEAVLNDFLRLVLDEHVWDYVIRRNIGTIWNPVPAESPRIPVEFSGAAMRLGHSMIRPKYNISSFQGELPLERVFQFTGKGSLNGRPYLEEKNVVDWRFFFDFDGVASHPDPGGITNIARGINTAITLKIDRLSEQHGQRFGLIANRNLARGNELRLPAGQDIAECLLSSSQMEALLAGIGLDRNYVDAFHAGLQAHADVVVVEKDFPGIGSVTPLWFYLLAEAEIVGSGCRLGKIGSLIVAEVIRGLVMTSSVSIFRHEQELLPLGGGIPAHSPGNAKLSRLLYLLHPEY